MLLLIFTVQARGQFYLNGDATRLNDTCFQLTPERNNAVGSIWNPEKIDLRQSFDVIVNIFLGCKDAGGADGIVFGFQPVSTSIGTRGEGIGFQNITPSLGIEFDTWQNLNLSDPAYDHIAFVRNGDLNHAAGNTLAGPAPISPSDPNVEDCRFHEIRVSWDAGKKELEAYFDCNRRLSYRGDLVRDIFRGDPFVFWGFTAATGGANNTQQICLTYTTFLDQLEDVVMCPGGQVPLRARGGRSYSWSPAEGLSNPFSATTFASPRQSTVYTVRIEDECGRELLDDVLVEVAGDSVFFDLGPDTLICEGDALRLDATTPTATYVWFDGNNQPVRSVSTPGYYEVTVTRTDTFCIASDAITIGQILYPRVELGPDTVLCEGRQMVLRGAFPGAGVLWSDGSRADTLLIGGPGRFGVQVSNACGTAEDEMEVAYDECNEAYIPNAFSPNEDGVNDRFTIYDNGDIVQVKSLRIYSRWGEELYYAAGFLPSGDERSGWDGRFRGREMPQGVYIYLTEIEFRDGSSETRAGEVLLLR